MRYLSFRRGGLRLKGYKLTGDLPIVKSHIPKTVRIPMSQHMGTPSRLLVGIGDIVEEGQVIGESCGNISANIHASVSGRISAIEKYDTPTGINVDTVVIETGGMIKNWYKEKIPYYSLKTPELLELIKRAGVVGLGGEGFPTHIKLSPQKDKKISLLIINGVESEPYITCDHSLMLEKTEEIIEGINIVMKILSVEKAVIAVSMNNFNAIEAFLPKLKGNKTSDINISPLGLKYPMGGEKQIIRAVLKKEIPGGGTPADIGVIVENVSTVYAVYEAIVYKKPLIERIITYTGDQVQNKGNYKIRIGTPFAHIFDDYDIPGEYGCVLAGGPMMGYEVTEGSTPILKSMAGIVVLPKKKNYRIKNKPCIRCSKCLNVCPSRLQPSELAKLCQLSLFKEAVDKFGLFDCIECGACSYICPSTIPITGLIRYARKYVTAQKGEL